MIPIIIISLISDNKISKLVEFSYNQFIVRLVNTFEQNNRQAGINRALNVFANNILFGGGRFVTDNEKIAGSTYLRFFAMFGFIGGIVLLMHIFLLFVSICMGKLRFVEKLFIITSVIVMLLHREHVIQLGAYTMFFLLYKHHKFSNIRFTSAYQKYIPQNYDSISIRR